MTYQEKLKDPRWQKKRLQILERDEWCCQICEDKESTLHIHHKFYEKAKDPWEIDDDLLITLCADCHQEESDSSYQINQNLLREVSRHFTSGDILNLTIGFNKMKLLDSPEIVSDIIGKIISNKKLMQHLIKDYLG